MIQQLTGVDANKLSAYRLTMYQWYLADELVEVLEVFDAPTRLFSKAEVPLIPDVVPMLWEMEQSFVSIRDHTEVTASIRVASQAALLLIDKYFSLTDESELYQIAMGEYLARQCYIY